MNSQKNKEYADMYTKLYPRLVAMAYGFTQSWADSEDLVQKLFMNVWVRYKENPGRIENLEHYILRAFRFTKIDYFRSKSTRGYMDSLEAIDERDNMRLDHMQEIAYVEKDSVGEAKKVMKKIKGMNLPGHKEKVLMLYVLGFKPREIAAKLGKTPGSISVFISRIGRELAQGKYETA